MGYYRTTTVQLTPSTFVSVVATLINRVYVFIPPIDQ
jgi:hypothetical protein